MRIHLEVVNTTDDPNEVKALVREVFGHSAAMTVGPTSNSPEDCITFGLEQLITQDQLTAFFRGEARYNVDLPKLKERTIKYLSKQLDSVIKHNEDKYT